MKNRSITINTTQISTYRGRAIGRAFYNAYMDFVKDPKNEKVIEQHAEEIREREKTNRAHIKMLEYTLKHIGE